MTRQTKNLDRLNQLMLLAEMVNAQATAASTASASQLSEKLTTLFTPSSFELAEMAKRAEMNTSALLSRNLGGLFAPSHKELDSMVANAEKKAAKSFLSKSDSMFAQLDLADLATKKSAAAYNQASPNPSATNSNSLFAHKATTNLTAISNGKGKQEAPADVSHVTRPSAAAAA